MQIRVTFIGGPEEGTTRIIDHGMSVIRCAEPPKADTTAFTPLTAMPSKEFCKMHTYIVRQVGRSAWAAIYEELA